MVKSRRSSVILRRFIAGFLATLITCTASVSAKVQLPPGREAQWAENNILFYNPGCEERPANYAGGPNYSGDTPPVDGIWEYWNGNCSNISAEHQQRLANEVDMLRRIGARYNIPWEAIPAQAMQESGWNSSVYNNCNNPLGIAGGDCDGYKKFSSVEEAYDYYAKTLVISDTRSTGLYADRPYSFVEYGQYGGNYSYAVCGSDAHLYRQCDNVPRDSPTPGYVQAVSSFICGIQKWADANGVPTSGERFDNFEDPFIDTRLGGNTTGNELTPVYAPRDSSSSVEICDDEGYPIEDNGPIEGEGVGLYVDGYTLFLQGQEPWGSKNYTAGDCPKNDRDDTYRAAGCGPSALANIITNMTSYYVTPDVMGRRALEMGARNKCGGGGTNVGPMMPVLHEYGLTYQWLGAGGWNESTISSVLKAGGMVLTSGSGRDPWTSGGHYVVIRGIDEQGNWYVLDSKGNGVAMSSRAWRPSELLSANNSSGGALYAIYKQ